MATQTATCTACGRTGILGEDIEEVGLSYSKKMNLCLKCCTEKLSEVLLEIEDLEVNVKTYEKQIERAIEILNGYI